MESVCAKGCPLSRKRNRPSAVGPSRDGALGGRWASSARLRKPIRSGGGELLVARPAPRSSTWRFTAQRILQRATSCGNWLTGREDAAGHDRGLQYYLFRNLGCRGIARTIRSDISFSTGVWPSDWDSNQSVGVYLLPGAPIAHTVCGHRMPAPFLSVASATTSFFLRSFFPRASLLDETDCRDLGKGSA